MIKYTIFIDILLLIGVVYLFSNCRESTASDNNKTNADYTIEHYIDTINGHVILSTVVNKEHTIGVSISTLELK